MGFTAQEWLRDPTTLYRALNGVAMRKIGQFNARQLQLPLLEKQALALRLYARELQSGEINALATARMSEIERLRSETEATKVKVHELLQLFIKVRSMLQSSVPGIQFLGAGPWDVGVAVALTTLAVYVMSRIDNIISMHDGAGKNLQMALGRVDQLLKEKKISPAQAAALRAKIVENGGLPDPGGAGAVGAAFGGGIVIAALAAFFLMNRSRRAA